MGPKAFLALFFMSFVLVALAIGTPPALAQNCSAKTCTQAYRGCAGVLCQQQRGGDCDSFCRAEFQKCMQTGEFHGRVCQKTGLKKK